MTPLLAVLIAAGLGSSLAPAQTLADPAGLRESVDALRSRADALKVSAAAQPKETPKGMHRLGHTLRVMFAAEAPDVSGYAVRGVDVSHYEGAIAWDKVKAAGTAFAYAKATEGVSFVDETFAANWKGASAAGVTRGAYHFYDFCETGAAQAAHFVKTVPPDDGALPMVIDLEQSNDCSKMPARAVFLKDLAAFVAEVRSAYGRAPILYVNLSIYDAYLKGSGSSYKLWIADPHHKSPGMPAGESWTFWQYSWHGKVAGIPSETDLDVFFSDAAALAALARP